jgi:cobalt/nickel transport system permease protein
MANSCLALHIPDGFLTPGICVVGWIIAAVVLHLAIRHSSEQFGERQVPLMGVMAAFIFAAQAINFPIIGGTSGHILGGALAGILVGPWAGVLVMTTVIIVQGLLFQDGGLLSMGWNIFNLGVCSVLTGYATYSLFFHISEGNRRLLHLAGFLAAWISVEVGAVAAALQLSASRTLPLQVALPALTGIYALIGIVEGIVTVAALGFIQASYPKLVQGESAPGRFSAAVVTICLAGALVVALLSPLASSAPDGLERVAEDRGFASLDAGSLFEIFPDYTISLLENPDYSTIVAVTIGTLLVFGMFLLLGRLIVRVRS